MFDKISLTHTYHVENQRLGMGKFFLLSMHSAVMYVCRIPKEKKTKVFLYVYGI